MEDENANREVPDEVIDLGEDDEGADVTTQSPDDASGSVNPFAFLSRRKRKNGSKVWDFMKVLSDVSAQCSKCDKIIAHPAAQTSQLIAHLKNCDAARYESVRKDITEKNEKIKKVKEEQLKKSGKQEKITDFVSVAKTLPKKVTESINESLVEWVVCSNNSFSSTEDHFFRKMVFNLNSSYVCPSRTKITAMVDEKKEMVDKNLKAEVQEDIKGCKTVAVTSDGGTSCDRMKTKKSCVTLTRITQDFSMKTDTLAVSTAVGSQTGPVIRTEWKSVLNKFGYDQEWQVHATTDAASNEKSARARNRHENVGLNIKYETDCVDHQVSGTEEC